MNQPRNEPTTMRWIPLVCTIIGIVVVGRAFQAPLPSSRFVIHIHAEHNNKESNAQEEDRTGNSMPLTELSRRQEAAGNMQQLATPYLLGETINKAAVVFIGVWFLLDLLGYGLVNDGSGLRIDTKEVAEMQRQINKTKPR